MLPKNRARCYGSFFPIFAVHVVPVKRRRFTSQFTAKVALEVERSFWEKATILHMEYYRPAEKPVPDRLVRHYADMAALWQHPVAGKALDRDDLCARVVGWKSQFFGSAWANYDQAKPGTFHLVPPSKRLPTLRRDYQAMLDMFVAEPKGFDDILATLAAVELRINRPK